MKSKSINFFIVLIVFLLTQNILNAQNPGYKIAHTIELPETEDIYFLGKNDENKLFMITYERLIGQQRMQINSINIKTFDEEKITESIKLEYDRASIIVSPDQSFYAINKLEEGKDSEYISKFTVIEPTGELIFEKQFPMGREYSNSIYLGNKYIVMNTYHSAQIFNKEGQLIKTIEFCKMISHYDRESLRDVIVTDEQIYFALNYGEKSKEDRTVTKKCMLYEYNINNDEERIVASFDNNQTIQQIEVDSSNGTLYLIIRERSDDKRTYIYRISENEQINLIYNTDFIGEIKPYNNYLIIQKIKNLKVINQNMEIIIDNETPHKAFDMMIKDNTLYYLTFNKDKASRRGQDIYLHNVSLIIQNLNSKTKDVIPLISDIKYSVTIPTDIIIESGKIIVAFYNKLFQITTL